MPFLWVIVRLQNQFLQVKVTKPSITSLLARFLVLLKLLDFALIIGEFIKKKLFLKKIKETILKPYMLDPISPRQEEQKPSEDKKS